MNSYQALKTVPIISSVILVGTGFGSAFYLFFVNRGSSLPAKAMVSRLVVRADTWFTTPAVVIQPLTGMWLAHLAGWPLDSPWLVTSMALYLLAGACWLPVLWLQWKMSRMAAVALAEGTSLPDRYGSYSRAWERLGYPAFGAMLVVFWLMVTKPPLWNGP